MIRLFSTLCKKISDTLIEEEAFCKATNGFRPLSEPCPKCGASGKLSPYGDYKRWLVSTDGKGVIAECIYPLRFKCGSCGVTHALLPDILVPYSPYSLRFKLAVLIAYFERDSTVAAVCESFGIAVSTVYEWKKLLESYKRLFLSAVLSMKEPALAFLKGLLGEACLSSRLEGFFRQYAISFMQARPMLATQFLPP
jgi:transposase-like protein/ribosomal protein S27AE